MTKFEQIAAFAAAAQASNDPDTIVKVAAESDVTRNDLIVHHNLTEGNIFTGEGIVKVAEDEAPSALLSAVDVYEKLATDQIDESQAMEMLKEAGLTADDFNIVADLLDKQAAEAGLVPDDAGDKTASDAGPEAEEAAWEKIAEAYEFLDQAGLDPVASLEFAEQLAAAESDTEQEKVASEWDGIDEESIDKIAQVVDYLSDIEGAPLSELMSTFQKEAASLKELGSLAMAKSKKAGRAYLDALLGKGAKEAKGEVKRLKKIVKEKNPALALPGVEGSLKQAKSKLRKIRAKQALAAGVPAAAVGTAGVAAANQ